jgi:hypothetical protein
MIERESSEHVFTLLRKKYGITYRIIRLVQRFSRSKANPIGLAIRISSA